MSEKKKKVPPKSKAKKGPGRGGSIPLPPKSNRKTGRGGDDWNRKLAGIHYVTTQQSISVYEMAKDPQWGVGESAMLRWSAEDKWVLRRQDYFDNITKEIETKLGEKLVQARVDSLKRMNEVYDDGMDMLLDGIGEVKSHEGLVSAMVKVADHIERTREKLVEQVVPKFLGGPTRDESQVTPVLTSDEARKAASAIMQHRREASRAKLAAPKEATDENAEKPKLTLIEGEKING